MQAQIFGRGSHACLSFQARHFHRHMRQRCQGLHVLLPMCESSGITKHGFGHVVDYQIMLVVALTKCHGRRQIGLVYQHFIHIRSGL
jgi:hypothetical protein